MNKFPQKSSVGSATERSLPVSEAIAPLTPAAAPQIEEIVQRRQAHQHPVFRMDKSLINTPPPLPAVELMEGARKSRYSAWELGPACGLPELRQEIANWRRNLYAERITSENVLITSGASAAFNLTVNALVRPEESVIVMPPCFPNYLGALRNRGTHITRVPLQQDNDFEPSLPLLETAWKSGARMAVCTLPNNPTATTLENACVNRIEKMAREHGGWVVIDETFSSFDLRPDIQPLKNLSLRSTITLGTFSEAFSLADLRVGYIIGPKELVRDIGVLQGVINPSGSARAQEVACAALREREAHFSKLIPALRSRDADLQDALTRVPGIESIVGYAGPFKWIKTGATDSAQLAVSLARETGITVRPGIDYGQEGWVRLAFGMIGTPREYAQALSLLRSFKGWEAPRWDENIKLPARPRAAKSGVSAAP
ncbi:MAG: pyridoxal phosphate-dependent aminotransferase [Deltaproteobacteria bacterium]|nr:pyridoxal phosphate-dependent aminotransferase [Deltaproteobacteria bacterium]